MGNPHYEYQQSKAGVGGVERLAKDTMPVVGLGSPEGAPQYPVSGARCPCKFLGLI